MTKKIHKENQDSIAICNEMNDNSRNDKHQKTDLEMSPFFPVLFMTWCQSHLYSTFSPPAHQQCLSL